MQERLTCTTGPKLPLPLLAAAVATLLAATAFVYWQVAGFDFVNFDDDAHVYQNPHVLAGLTLDGAAWAFGIHGPSQWHPLAWLSHQLDCELFGLDPRGHHATSIVLHALTAVCLFLALFRLTGFPGRSLFVALLFAVHPLNVESVAWISERRNVLCGFFWMLALLAYAGYARQGGRGRYLLVAVCVACSLMAKPMAVTLPLVLLLLDYWPLDRVRPASAEEQCGTALDGPATAGPSKAVASVMGVAQSVPLCPRRSIRFLVLEKVPLLALAVASGVLSILCQQSIGTVASLQKIPLTVRVANAFVAYGAYLRKMVWPGDLAVFYPHPALFSSDTVGALMSWGAAFGLLLAAVTGGVIYVHRRYPFLAIGWLWFLITLLPMIGIVQVGEQQYADRYCYVPLIGIFIAVAWLCASVGRRRPGRFSLASVAAVLVTMLFAAAAFVQAGHWRDSIALFEHTLSVTERNSWAHVNLGLALKEKGQHRAAIQHYQQAIEIDPDYALAHFNLGVAWHDVGRRDLASDHLLEAIRADARFADAYVRLGTVRGEQGDLEGAVRLFRQAARIDPRHTLAQLNLAVAYHHLDKLEEAIQHYRRALELDPGNPKARYGLSQCLSRQHALDRLADD